MSAETLASDTIGLNENNGGKSRHINKMWLFHRHRDGLAACQCMMFALTTAVLEVPENR